MKKRVYISIPISGLDYAAQKRKAEQLAEQHRSIGRIAITPFEIIPREDPKADDIGYCMGRDIEELLHCDTVCFARGWQYSRGCMAEFTVAKIYGKTIEFEEE